MRSTQSGTFLIPLTAFFLSAIVTFKNTAFAQPVSSISQLQFLGQYEIPFAKQFKNTTIGGLSGIDYDAANKRYYFICDDRSAINPARYYTADITVTGKVISNVQFTGVQQLLQPNGKSYPGNKQDRFHTPDPEAMRYDPIKKKLTWSSEGERTVNRKDTVLVNPSIITILTKGNYLKSYTLPHNLAMQAIEKGPRRNGVLEGLTFADNYTTLFANVEEPLYEDGPRADTMNNNAYIRILKFDVGKMQNTQQFAYKLEPVAYPPFPANALKINGVTDILYIGKNKLLLIERSFSSGRLGCSVKLFIADLKDATDIKDIPSLSGSTYFIPATKKLLLNMDTLGIFIDNIEGVSFGPQLSNGHKTLLFVSDNNFNPLEKTQLLLFEVIE